MAQYGLWVEAGDFRVPGNIFIHSFIRWVHPGHRARRARLPQALRSRVQEVGAAGFQLVASCLARRQELARRSLSQERRLVGEAESPPAARRTVRAGVAGGCC